MYNKSFSICLVIILLLVMSGCGSTIPKYNQQKSYAYNTVKAADMTNFYVKDNERPTGIAGVSVEGLATVVTTIISPATLFISGGPWTWISANFAKNNRIFGWIEADTYEEAQKKFAELVLKWLRALDKDARIVKVDGVYLFYYSPGISKKLKKGELKADYDPAMLMYMSNKKKKKPLYSSVFFIVYKKKSFIPEWIAPGNKQGFMCYVSDGIVKSIPEKAIENDPYFFYYSAPTKEQLPYLVSWEGKKYLFLKPQPTK